MVKVSLGDSRRSKEDGEHTDGEIIYGGKRTLPKEVPSVTRSRCIG